MSNKSVKTEEKPEVSKESPERFIVFVARGERPLVSFSNFAPAEETAIIFAGLANAQMEVFDSEKEVCYFVEPFEARATFRSLKIPESENKK